MSEKYKKTANNEGKDVVLGGHTFMVPALSLRQLKTLRPKLAALSATPSPEMAESEVRALEDAKMAVVVEVVHAALSRNYANITLDEMEDLLDIHNLPEAMEAVMNLSGLVRMGKMFGLPMGMGSPTGTESTSASSIALDGAGST